MAEIVADPTGPEVDAELNCSAKTRWSLLNKGELDGYYVGSKIRITRESVDEYKQRRRYIPRSAPQGKGALMESRRRKGSAT